MLTVTPPATVMASQTQTSTYALPSTAMKKKNHMHSHSLSEPDSHDAPSARNPLPHSHSHSYVHQGLEASKHASNSQHQAHDHHSHSKSTSAMNGTAPEPVIFPNGATFHVTSNSSIGGRPPGEYDLGRPFQTVPLDGADPDLDASRRLSMMPQKQPPTTEILTAVMLPLPFLLASLLSVAGAPAPGQHTITELVEEVASEALPIAPRASNMIQACLLTSGTLICLGLLGRLVRSSNSAASGPSPAFLEGVSLNLTMLRNLLQRMLSIGLPFLATVELGGVRTGIILLGFVSSGFMIPEVRVVQGLTTWRDILRRYKWTFIVLFACLVLDLNYLAADEEAVNVFRGYTALTKCALFLQLPLPTSSPSSSSAPSIFKATHSQSRPNSVASASSVVANAFDNSVAKPTRASPLIASIPDADLTLTAGCMLCLVTTFLAGFLSLPLSPSYASLFIAFAVISSATSFYLTAEPQSLLSPNSVGLITGMLTCFSFWAAVHTISTPRLLSLSVMCVAFYLAAKFGSSSQRAPKKYKSEFPTHHHGHNHDHSGHHHHEIKTSAFTKTLLAHTEVWPTLHGVLREKESRRVVYFMSLNLGFMFVQSFYAYYSGSLGLLADSIHMFFDCIGLLAGLFAVVMRKWPPNPQFPYGYGKVETLSGLGNGIFLMIISVEIIWESLERFVEGAPLQHLTELLFVSIAGLIVNVVGLVFIPHAHHHGHDHGDAHGHDHSNENMQGIWLHVLADTMGSVAVIISTILTWYSGWSGWDPLASFTIAILIIAASWPLFVGSAQRLLLTIPGEIEYSLRNTLQELSDLRGVAGYAVPRFWLEDGPPDEHDHDHSHNLPHDHHHGNGHDHHDHHDHHHHHDLDGDGHNHNHNNHGPKILGVIHVIASRPSDLEDLRGRVERFFHEKNMSILVHVEREGQGECWCGKQVAGGANAGFVSM